MTERPDALVLGAGGTLGEAWMRGLLSGGEAAAGLDLLDCEYFLGTSAGSIVATVLAAGRRLEAGDRAAREWSDDAGRMPPPSGRGARARLVARAALRTGAALATPFAPLTLAGAAPAGAAVRAAVLTAAPRPRRNLSGLGRYVESLGARFDGRLRIAALDRRTGRRVVFGAPGAPPASVRDAVLASCAVPWLFAPVRIGGREYVDGGVWSPTNLDAIPAGRGARVLCLVPTGAGGLRVPSWAAAAAEAMAVRARGADVRTIAPDAASAAAMGVNLMDGRRVEAVLDAAFAQGRATASA